MEFTDKTPDYSPLSPYFLILSNNPIKAGGLELGQHLLGVFAVGKGADLDAVELIGGRLLRPGGGLYRLLMIATTIVSIQ